MNSASSVERRDNTAESRLQLLVETVTDYGIFMLDPEGYVASWNIGAEKLKGYKREEIVGRHFSTFYPPDVVATGWPEEELRRARKQGRFEDEGWRVRKDGTRFWANVIITALHDDTGELTGFAKITRDLTERRQYEQELRASEQRFRLLMDSVRDYAIFMLDVDGRIRSWNAGAMALKGYTADEVIGRHFSLFYTPEDQAAGKPATELRQAQAIGRVEDEGWRVRKDGNLFWANVIITAMHDDTGALVGFAKITRDMTTRKRLEELERSSRMMNEFLAMLAHELRNPLAPMRNAVTLMQLEPLASPSLRNSRDIIDRQLTHVTRLVDDLLDVGRITTGKVKLRRELVRVADVVMRSCETVRPLIEARKHGLTVEVPAEPIYINADPTRVSQILQNLMVNAAKYTPDGGHIVISAKQIDGFVCIAVEDTGRGIEERDLQRIFELFMQGENGSPSESGLGIGLTLARSLAELHGGRLDAQSEGVGKGSTFILRLPVARQAEAVSDDQEQALRPQGLRVLVVDDNRDAADSATAIIRMLGDDAECAYSGAGALESVRRSVPDVVLLDLAMPVLDGFATLRQLREVPGMEHAFVVAMTGYGSTDDKRRTTGAGFDAHVTKPVDLNQLLALLKQAREQRAAPPSTGN